MNGGILQGFQGTDHKKAYNLTTSSAWQIPPFQGLSRSSNAGSTRFRQNNLLRRQREVYCPTQGQPQDQKADSPKKRARPKRCHRSFVLATSEETFPHSRREIPRSGEKTVNCHRLAPMDQEIL
ncbi:uncharacterized protein LOC143646813 [Tamandua tetradactyla]|uniref:uncharacterized protein LOC143646813 n=1 Tax=Tamandua tetradactyla TaxID=48850 RepID=UPI00405380A6